MSKVMTEVGRKLVIDTFAKQGLVPAIGATLEKVDYGQVWIKFPHHPMTTQHHGYFHGGIISYLADISAGLSGFTRFTQEESTCLTIEFKINFLKAAQGKWIMGRGEVIQETGGLFINRADIYSDKDELVATMLQTNKKMVPKK